MDDHYRLVARFVVAEVALAVGLAVVVNWPPFRKLVHFLLGKLPIVGKHLPPLREGRLLSRTAWYVAFRENAEGEWVFVSVQLANGTEYFGTVFQYTSGDDPLSERELVLRPPLAIRHAGTTERQALPDDWKQMILHGEGIVAIAVSYK